MAETPFTWSAKYSVGDSVLDSQHRKLLGLCMKLKACLRIQSSEGDELFHAVLNDLSEYARVHFLSEERILQRADYPQLNEQIEEHKQYQEKVLEFTLNACDGALKKEALFNFLSQWWLDHILGSDMEYKAHLEAYKNKIDWMP